MKIFIYFYLYSIAALSNELVIKSVSAISPWKSGQAQQIQIEVAMPPLFHAYTEQFKISEIAPVQFNAGQIKISPEIEFFDKYTNKKRMGILEKGIVHITIEAPEQLTDPLQKVNFQLRSQICSETVCYLPKKINIDLTPIENLVTQPAKQEEFSLLGSFEKNMQSSLFLTFLSVFIAGVLTSFTPCIFPMLPITISILGYEADKKSRLYNFSKALAYVFGIAMTYSILGVVAALTGSLFGSALTNKYVVFGLVLLFFVMALSMWGVFELQSPAFIRNRFGSGKSKGFGGAFLMGLVAGIVASPCVGPVLVSILSYVSTTKDVVLGFTLLFTFAMGLGLLFLIIGVFSSALKLLPKSGRWMDAIKFILGAAMWCAALYYAQFLLTTRLHIALIALSFFALALWKGAFHFHKKNYIKQSFLLALFIFSTSVLVISAFRPEYLSTAFSLNTNTEKSKLANWAPYSAELLALAKQENKPVMIDFFADWCAACHELDNKTFNTDEFKQLSEGFILLKFDATNETPAILDVLKKYNVKGLPTVLFINRNGTLLNELTFTQFLEISALKPKMQEALK